MAAHDFTRKQRIEKIMRTYEEAEQRGVEIDENKLIAQCCIDWGCTKRTVLEYLEIVKTLRS